MSSVRRNLCFGGGIALLCVLLFLLGSSLVPPRSPIVEVSGAEFGTAWAQPDYHCQLLLHNRSGRPLKLVDVETSCHCTAVPQHSGDLPVEGTLPVDMSIDASLDETGLPREFSSTIILVLEHSDSDPRRVPVRVHGWIRPNPIVLEPESVDFGELVRGHDPDPTRRVRMSLANPVRDLDVRAEAEWVSRVQLLPAATGRDAVLEVSLDPDLPYGPFASTVELRGIAEVSDRRMTYRVPISGQIVTDVRSMPPQIACGARRLGSAVTETLTVRSRTGAPIAAVRVTSIPESSRVQNQRRSNDGMGIVFDVIQSVEQGGLHRAALELEVTREGSSESVNFEVPITWYGVDPDHNPIISSVDIRRADGEDLP